MPVDPPEACAAKCMLVFCTSHPVCSGRSHRPERACDDVVHQALPLADIRARGRGEMSLKNCERSRPCVGPSIRGGSFHPIEDNQGPGWP